MRRLFKASTKFLENPNLVQQKVPSAMTNAHRVSYSIHDILVDEAIHVCIYDFPGGGCKLYYDH